MTAEIAILNKDSVALAADSAITLGGKGREKIFISANKLFALSKYHPVGMMVFGNATFMQISWEKLIKIFKHELGDTKYNTLEEYSSRFITFLKNSKSLFPEEQQKQYLQTQVFSYFYLIRKEIEDEVEKIYEQGLKVTKQKTIELTTNIITKHHNELNEIDLLPPFSKKHIKAILNKYKIDIIEIRDEIFEKLPIKPIIKNYLNEIGASLFVKNIFPSDISGIVITGFGEKDVFPSLRSFTIDGVVADELIFKSDKKTDITFDSTASIISFAQQEMVYTFMEGIEPTLMNEINHDLNLILTGIPEIIVNNLEKLNDKEKTILINKLKVINIEIFNKFTKKISEVKWERFSKPIVEIVSMLPKEELAEMAESLVSLTSFKRKMSMDSETVGGPIDVAVISKGDGFIWIKRKHYFNPEKNPQFFANYYRSNKNEKKTKKR